ncbi:MAG TPA: glycoside hydrolase family 97 C-terminal domain-containing protein, partial [Puia sp.]|nr:glycoside hydrolase family 97 C-terminal domain-containing protein [Puia sp.]
GVGREVELGLDWLAPGTSWEATIYSDASDAGVNPNHLVREIRRVRAGDSVLVRLAPGGGEVMRLKRE